MRIRVIIALAVIGMIIAAALSMRDGAPTPEPLAKPQAAELSGEIVPAGAASVIEPTVGATEDLAVPAHIPAVRVPKESVPAPAPSPTVRIARLDTYPPSVSGVLGLGETRDHMARTKALKQLGTALSSAEIAALYLLLDRQNNEDKLKPGQLNALKDAAVGLLEKQSTPPPELAHNLIAMYHDKRHDVVWRDYCIQHLGTFYRKIPSAADKAAAHRLFWAGTDEKAGTFAGTSLIALTANSDLTGGGQQIAGKAVQIATDTTWSEASRVTSLQIAANLGDESILPVARQAVGSGASTHLRMSAIAAIGTLGSEKDRLLLEKYAASTDTRLRAAATSALGRLQMK
jgi:hypothetical protein